MKILFENQVVKNPRVSFILLDWSCRESFHSLDYFANQGVPRDQYEIIWIEYYSHVSPQIQKKMKEYEQSGKPPVIDQWLIMEIPDNIYYHKHLMYNLGIIASKGEIIVICDSDVMVKPSLVGAIIKEFESSNNSSLSQSDIVLHLDEVRNTNRKYYPFNNPTFDEVISEGCLNWIDGKTKGLWDKKDPLHSRNYGACMAAKKDDLIAIGGADEHIDYLGHMCGPYEMTFRLTNTGKNEIWHQSEFLFHTWHPGTDGDKNYHGPHDGRNISSTALKARYQGRIFPLNENPSIKIARLGETIEDKKNLMFKAVEARELDHWDLTSLKIQTPSVIPKPAALGSIMSQFWTQCVSFFAKPWTLKILLRGVFFSSFKFLWKTSKGSNLEVIKCENCLNELQSEKIKEFAILGLGRAAETLYSLARDRPIAITRAYDADASKTFKDINIFPLEQLVDFDGKLVICSFNETEELFKLAKENGVDGKRIKAL